ncbi:MAG: GntR family transcriptional regulator [Saprospiraceae bacterium]|nr:MAG: GntR family transcriptional regulator [Saprospiraceae bacterium]
MAAIGQWNELKVVKELDFGLYLDGQDLGEVLLPRRYVPDNCKPEDIIKVFIYLDSEDRYIATTEKPFACVGDFALLKVAAVNNIGAFLDWGLPKDLLVPFREQKQKMEAGRSYLVYLYVDEDSQRIAASNKLNKFLDKTPHDFSENQEVDLIIAKKTDLGYKAIINGTHWGVLYENELFQPLHVGQAIKGFVKKIREDQKVDLSLQTTGYEKIPDLAESILQQLQSNNGFLPVNDKSSAETIYARFSVSKKSFKKAVGNLYKKRLITIEKDGLRLIKL